jgi:pimeloyl-ACP methyl ester carboxylesterase
MAAMVLGSFTTIRLLGAVEPAHAARSANVVGRDIGGMVAYAFASQFPDAAETVTIIDVPLPGTPIFDAIAADPRAWYFSFHAAPDVPEALTTGREAFYYSHFMQAVDASAGAERRAADARALCRRNDDPHCNHGRGADTRQWALDPRNRARTIGANAG